MNILFLTIVEFKDICDKGIYTDLLREFYSQGHNIYIVSPIEKREGKRDLVFKNDDDRVNYLRVAIGNITKCSLFEKGLSTLQVERKFLDSIKSHFSAVKFDLVLYSTPPITFSNVVRYIKKRDQAKSYLLLKDIFPQNAVDLKMFGKNNPIYWYFRHKEKSLYNISDYIGCMSQKNVEYVTLHNNIEKEKIEVCPNSIEPVIQCNFDKNEIRYKYKIPGDKVVFVYGGNLGRPQGINYLCACLEECKDNEKVFFCIVGSGTEFSKLNCFLNKQEIKNALLLESLPKDEYDLFINAGDVGLIFLDKCFTIPNFPSRLLSYMQVGMPVLAATDGNTDVGTVIKKGQFGHWCESISSQNFADLLPKFYAYEDRQVMGKNARNYLENNYTVKRAYEIIINHFI